MHWVPAQSYAGAHMTYWSIDLTDVFIDQVVQGEKKKNK